MGDFVVVGSCSGMLYAFERDSGAVVWEYDIKQDGEQRNFHGDALVLDDLLFIGTDGPSETGTGHLYAFDWSSGEVRWKTPVDDIPGFGRGVSTDIQSLGDRLFATTLADAFTCYDRHSGEVRWRRTSTYDGSVSSFTGTAAVGAGGIYFGGLDGRVYALDPADGSVRWESEVGGTIQTSVVATGAAVYAGTAAAQIVRLDRTSGEIVARIDLDMALSRTMAYVDGRIVVLADWMQDGGSLICIDAALEKILWRRQASSDVYWSSAKPYVTEAGVMVGTSAGSIYEYRVSDGELIWATQVEGTIRGVGLTDDAVFVGTVDGRLYSLSR